MINRINVEFENVKYVIIVSDDSELLIKPCYEYLTLEDIELHKKILLKTKDDLKKLLNKN